MSEKDSKCQISICPYTHTQRAFENCCIGCEKPGIGSINPDPSRNCCSDCALLCTPFTIIADILCYIPMCFHLYNVSDE